MKLIISEDKFSFKHMKEGDVIKARGKGEEISAFVVTSFVYVGEELYGLFNGSSLVCISPNIEESMNVLMMSYEVLDVIPSRYNDVSIYVSPKL